MTRRVTMVECSVYERLYPLVSGYLQAYALKHPENRSQYTFRHCSRSVKTPFDEILRSLLEQPADVYAMSCYMWNIGLARRLVERLLVLRPEAYIILGGPQVMHHGEDVLPKTSTRVMVCNGEGERTFNDLLLELTTAKPDLGRVGGISFREEGVLRTTTPYERLPALDDIPSPFLAGLFSPDAYTVSIFETNRGCPYNCSFCYWGAATNTKIFQFDDERVKDEITWLGRHHCFCLNIADANWGILPRDIAISQHIAECAKKYGTPRMVYYAAAKNKPERLTEITEIFINAGMMATQPISLQTMNPESLRLAKRSNIKEGKYIELQERLKERQISSYTELIWPLPGERLTTLEQGVDRLCRAEAGAIVIYPHLLLRNTDFSGRKEELGLLTRHVTDGVYEAQLVVGTADVPYEEFLRGLWFYYSLQLLHNAIGLDAVTRYLAHTGLATHANVFQRFAEFMKASRGNPVTRFIADSVENGSYYQYSNFGLAVHIALHEERAAFEHLLRDFLASSPWWSQPDVRALSEVDSLCRPYLYSNSPLVRSGDAFEHVSVLDVDNRAYIAQVPPSVALLMTEIGMRPSGLAGGVYRIDHARRQAAVVAEQSPNQKAFYCETMIIRSHDMRPTWDGVAAGAEFALADPAVVHPASTIREEIT